MRRLLRQQTWPSFNPDFTTVHQELRNTDTTVDELGFSSANVIAAQIVDQLRGEVPVKVNTELQIVMTTPYSLSDNLPTANEVQSASNPTIASLMVSMMASMEEMREQLDESDATRRDGNGQFGSRQRNRQQVRRYFNGRNRGRGYSTTRDNRTT